MRHIEKLLLPLLLFACRQAAAPTRFQLMDNTGIRFSNNVEDGPQDNSFFFRNFYNGGGVAIGDVNNDGLADVFLTSNMGTNKLYLNKGNFQFEDITDKAGFRQDSMWSTGVVFVDINNDGWLDIYVSNSGHMTDGNRRNKLYINNHDNTFTESAAQYGLAISAYTTQVTFFDYDGDGDLDCFMINNSPIPVNTLNNSNRRDLPDSAWPVKPQLKGGGDHLFRNDNGHFTEVTQQAGIHGSLISFGLGALVTDINNDGWPDVYVSNDSYERDYLYINQKNGTFKDDLEDCMGHISMSSMGTDMADINNDGCPDLFTTDMLPGDDYRLKTTASFDNTNIFNLKVRSGFYNQFVKNCLQLNNRNGKFLEIGNYAGVSATDWSWGALMFDADNDGFNDIYVCNGVNRDLTDLDFLNFFADDVYSQMAIRGNKKSMDELLKKIPRTPLLNKVFHNNGNLHFTDIGEQWGFNHPSFANGAAYGDLDNDGDLDLVVNNENGPAFVYKNNSRQMDTNHYIGIFLKGPSPNTYAIGSKIRIYKAGSIFYRELVPSRGFQSSIDYKQIIGLGPITNPDSLVITWPNNRQTAITHPAVDSVYAITQPSQQKNSSRPAKPGSVNPSPNNSGSTKPAPTAAPGGNVSHKALGVTNTSSSIHAGTRRAAASTSTGNQPQNAPSTPTLLTAVQSHFDKHQETDYNDLVNERNLPKMLSREGPKAATADVNGDGLADVFIGGTPGHPGQLYLQVPAGKSRFVKSPQPAIDAFSDFSDESVLFFDANGDGKPDLFIGPGGNSNPPYSRQMQLRLFLNDGKGHFQLAADAFPTTNNGVNTGTAIAGDFNNDGHIDLFVGGRSIPREYGADPSSCIFLGDGKGRFTDIAPAKNPDIAHIGMVTSAAWADLTGEGQPQLLIAGEWMTPKIFHWKNNHFEEEKTNLDKYHGWWESLKVADLNGDGKPDLILGNLGENFYFCPDSTHPVKLWISDFDNNGIKDKILTSTLNGKDMPVFMKHEMEDQVPSLKKKNLKHAVYAKKSIQELFQTDKAQTKLLDYCSSIVAINEGKGQFSIRKLPPEVQLSSVNAIVSADVNHDGKPDLIIGGNEFGFLPQFGRLDASLGDVLLGDGKGNFTFTWPDRSGLDLPGQVRDIALLPAKDHVYLLFLRNNEIPVLYSFDNQPNAK